MQTNQNNGVALEHLGRGQAQATFLLCLRAQGPQATVPVLKGKHTPVCGQTENSDEQSTNRE